jgi:hypothetical protein
MGPFNRGEVEYIKAISGGHSHHTYLANATDWTLATTNSDTLPNDALSRVNVFTLLDPLVFDPTNHPNDATNTAPIAYSSQFSNGHQNIPVYTIAKASDRDNPNAIERRAEQFFLDKVTGRMRIVLPTSAGAHSSDHVEYRMIVFRHKERQHFDQERALNFCNPDYDLFLTATNHKCGIRGYRHKDHIQGDEEYVSLNGYFNKGQYLMTAMLNKEDYVVMKDTRFYLGKEYGGKHIYETNLSWDHRDQLESEFDIIIDSDTAVKNYCWYIMLLRTNNDNTQTSFTDPTSVNWSFTTSGTS